MRKINYLSPDQFEYKFKRKPKMWSLEQLHDLYLKATERAASRWKDLENIMDVISKEIPLYDNYPNGSEHIVHFTQDGVMRMITLKYDSRYGSYSRGIRDIEHPKNRTDKLNYLFTQPSERSIELGEEYRRLEKLQSGAYNSMHLVRGALVNHAQTMLNEKIKGLPPIQVPDSYIVKIGSKEYIFRIDDKYNFYSSYKFIMMNEVTDKCLVSLSGSPKETPMGFGY